MLRTVEVCAISAGAKFLAKRAAGTWLAPGKPQSQGAQPSPQHSILSTLNILRLSNTHRHG